MQQPISSQFGQMRGGGSAPHQQLQLTKTKPPGKPQKSRMSGRVLVKTINQWTVSVSPCQHLQIKQKNRAGHEEAGQHSTNVQVRAGQVRSGQISQGRPCQIRHGKQDSTSTTGPGSPLCLHQDSTSTTGPGSPQGSGVSARIPTRPPRPGFPLHGGGSAAGPAGNKSDLHDHRL